MLIGIVEFGALQQGIDITKRINESRFNELEYQNSKDLDIDIDGNDHAAQSIAGGI